MHLVETMEDVASLKSDTRKTSRISRKQPCRDDAGAVVDALHRQFQPYPDR